MLAEAATVEAAVYDALGRRVAVLHEGALEAGAHRLVLDEQARSALPGGTYLVRVTVKGETGSARQILSRRLTLVR